MGGPSAEEVCAALRALGTKVPEEGHDLSRAQALGLLLMTVEGALVVEDDPLALEAARQGYFSGLVGQVKVAGIPNGSWDAPLQEMWVRCLELRTRRSAYDWSNLRQELPADAGERSSWAAVDALLSAVADLLNPFYPRLHEENATYVSRLRAAFRSAGAHIVSARRGMEAHRRHLKDRGFKA